MAQLKRATIFQAANEYVSLLHAPQIIEETEAPHATSLFNFKKNWKHPKKFDVDQAPQKVMRNLLACFLDWLDASSPNCFDTRKARLIKRRWVNVGGCFVRGGKRYFAVVKADASPKFERKSPSSRSKKTNGAERKTVRRQMIFKSDDWYEKAALSMAIKRQSVTSGG
jgi:hypothetical protein